MQTPQPRARSRAARTLASGAALVLLFVVATGQASTDGCEVPDPQPPTPTPNSESVTPSNPQPVTPSRNPDTGGGSQPARPAGPPPFPEVRREPGVVQGIVLDAQGRPIAGANVSIGGQLNVGPMGRGFVTTTSDAQGRYRVELPQGIVEVHASTRLTFDGRRYTLALHPADDQRTHEDVSNGIVENFYLRISGPLPGVEPIRPDRQYNRWMEMAGQHYGGYMQVDLMTAPRFLPAFHEGDVIELRLTPVAPLLDGTQGQVLTFRRQITASTRNDWYQFDIPLGRYRVEAFASVDGEPMRPMRVKTDAQDSPVGSVIADVLPHGSENDGARASSTSATFRVEVHR